MQEKCGKTPSTQPKNGTSYRYAAVYVTTGEKPHRNMVRRSHIMDWSWQGEGGETFDDARCCPAVLVYKARPRQLVPFKVVRAGSMSPQADDYTAMSSGASGRMVNVDAAALGPAG